ncbi:hypothetical protein [Okeania sp. SIO2B3]|uniref:hypothetical protein n=1 Tax=Okeania sp. SIO2B3 TaxID=2607784 RepID=UPI0013BF7233|nr:hypothetical protein [Okeania sp. SIO2B3]NET46672.1 hypothetical protein [Okeania sp. SIO2B3]
MRTYLSLGFDFSLMAIAQLLILLTTYIFGLHGPPYNYQLRAIILIFKLVSIFKPDFSVALIKSAFIYRQYFFQAPQNSSSLGPTLPDNVVHST